MDTHTHTHKFDDVIGSTILSMDVVQLSSSICSGGSSSSEREAYSCFHVEVGDATVSEPRGVKGAICDV